MGSPEAIVTHEEAANIGRIEEQSLTKQHDVLVTRPVWYCKPIKKKKKKKTVSKTNFHNYKSE